MLKFVNESLQFQTKAPSIVEFVKAVQGIGDNAPEPAFALPLPGPAPYMRASAWAA